MAVPKRRITNRRKGNRRSQAHGKIVPKNLAICSNCGSQVMPHAICSVCGFYKGKQILVKLV